MSDTNFDHTRYCNDQAEAIRIYKWEMSEEAGHDLGNQCISKWVSTYAEAFRTIALRTGEYTTHINTIDMVSYWIDIFHEIEKYKWIESEKAGHDIGKQCVKEWIIKYYDTFEASALNNNKYDI